MNTAWSSAPAGEIRLSRSELTQENILSPSLYDCPICGNHGTLIRRDEKFRYFGRECECMAKRRNLQRIRRSGLEKALGKLTFSAFQTDAEWRKIALEKAKRYAAHAESWLLVCGRSGTGKTHLCTAICGEILQRGTDVRYVIWREFAHDAKAAVNNQAEYSHIMQPLQECTVLYLDDLFKTGAGRDRDGNKLQMWPSAADVHLAYELLNKRYLDDDKVTILSSELTARQLMDIDEALGSRIFERCNGNVITLTGHENWRLTHAS